MKILATDFDHTLADKGIISKKNIEAIQTYKAQGNKIGLCTGRSLNTIKNTAIKLHFDFYILSTGSYILDENFNILSISYIEKNIAENIYALYHHKAIITYHSSGTLHTSLKDSVNQISLFAFTKNNAKKIAKSINENFPALSAYQNSRSVDIVRHGVSKGTGIDFIRNYYHHPVISVGDSFNDIAMFVHSDYAYTFYSSDKEVQSYCNQLIHHFYDIMSDH